MRHLMSDAQREHLHQLYFYYDKMWIGLATLGDLERIMQVGSIKMNLHELATLLPRLGIQTGPH